MLSVFDSLRDLRFISILVRMLLALLCGSLIGIERSYKNRPAGFRTHILLCCGAAVASMTGIYLYLYAYLPVDISRIGAQVVSGIGFIGAGTIIVTGEKSIKGLTTAAGLWATGIIGLAIGGGHNEGAVIATVMVLITQTLAPHLEQSIKYSPDFSICVFYRLKPSLDDVLRYCKDEKFIIRNLQVTSDSGDTPTYSAVVTLRPRRSVDRERFFEHIRDMEGILELNEITDQ